MREWPHLPNAPIREAVLDIQVTLPAAIGLKQLERMHLRISDRYPKRRTRTRLGGSLDLKSGEFRPAPAKLDGYLFLSEDERQIVQARLEGFTVNRLKPYATWESLRSEAQSLWGLFVDIAHPEAITRISLRYINRLEIPLPMPDLREYLRTSPDIAREIPHAVSELFMRLVIPQPTGAVAIVTETLEPIERRSSGDILPFILDIDVLRQEALVPSNVDALWERFGQLRDVKNEIFFNSITPKAEALFR